MHSPAKVGASVGLPKSCRFYRLKPSMQIVATAVLCWHHPDSLFVYYSYAFRVYPRTNHVIDYSKHGIIWKYDTTRFGMV